ncbi:ABC transporter ATP-binding protein [Brochothrix campestris]|uniref:Teichoic acids export protein ATP-binding subunit n=1 Tax=Brochothrix campestris FSL F6-1037 TaxID=1265861 RepID=W7DAC4_9LIST|nr:ABC transporter ATP-binding protein [Brochothrix campestris]EUJ42213.1 teichoic acids export protein ATP-binding subunit [Brochothrix campestris FSL F6-1037]
MNKIAIECINVTKRFELKKRRINKPLTAHKRMQFNGLENVSFRAHQGDVVAILGLNGSGKSTLSNIIADVTTPTSGKVKRLGTVSLLAINAGLKPALSGFENMRLKCLFHGLSEKESGVLLSQMVVFSELGDFLYQPVKSYSSGMKAKLGFSVAIHMNPDCLIIDEALAVGDQTFYQKCIDKINDFKAEGKTIFYVSHSLAQIRQLCNKALWLEGGRVRKYGPAKQVCDEYQQFVNDIKQLAVPVRENQQHQQMLKQTIPYEKIERKKIQVKWYTWLYLLFMTTFLITSIYYL